MPSNRRVKMLVVMVVMAVVFILYFTGEARSSRRGDFYKSTTAALDAQKKAAQDRALKEKADADLEVILKNAAALTAVGSGHGEAAKAAVYPQHVPTVAENVDGEQYEEVSVAGRKTMPKLIEKPKYPTQPDLGDGEEKALNGHKIELVDPGAEEAEEELNRILKKSPIIIFSKTFCPYSRRAKSILLDAYEIVPAPYVVELDTLDTVLSHAAGAEPVTMGRKLQELLAENTGRRTVPNVLINGRSIGGGDDIAQLDADDALVDKVKELGGKWLHGVKKREAS